MGGLFDLVTSDPFAQFSLFMLAMTVAILALFMYLNRMAIRHVKAERTRQVKLDEEKLRGEIREKLLAEFDRDHQLKLKDMKADFRQARTKVTSLVYKIKNLQTTMSSEKIVKELADLLCSHFPAGRMLILLRHPDDPSRLLFACGRGDDLPKIDTVAAGDLPVAQLAMSRGLILSREDALHHLQTLDRTKLGLEPKFTVPLVASHETGTVAKGVLLLLDTVEEPDADDMTLLTVLSSLAGNALDGASDLESSRRLSEKQMKEKKRLTSLFSKYVSSNVVDAMLDSDAEVELGGVEAKIAIFFADLRSFTTMAETMGPGEVVGRLNEFFGAMNEIIFKWNGTLDKYMGDAIMALFGAPVKGVDDAFRAVACGMEMMAKLAELNTRWQAEGKKPLAMGIGINFGAAVVGNIGSERRLEYTAIGDAVNVASRLCGIAAPGQLLISEDVFMEIMEAVDVKRLEPLKVKGRAEPVVTYEVTRII